MTKETYTPKKPRYNEKQITKNFLSSQDGIKFLSDNINIKSKLSDNIYDLQKDVTNIIDFFVAWSNKFPLRRADKMSRYEFIKFIEDWIDKNDMLDVFEYLYDE